MPDVVLRGPGCRTRLADLVDELGLQRVVLVTGARMQAAGVALDIEGTLGRRHVGTTAATAAHAPVSAISAMATRVRGWRPDGIVSVGGGSVHDTAKALAILMAYEAAADSQALEILSGSTHAARQGGDAPLPVISLPTTFSAAEVVPGGATTDASGHKLLFGHSSLRIAAVFLDAELVASTPRAILVSSAMNAVHHCLESAYSLGRQPITMALAAHAFGCLTRALARFGDGVPPIDVLQEALDGSSLSGLAYVNSQLGIGHAVCHGLGGRFGIAHGTANAVMLHHSLQFNRLFAAEAAQILAQTAGLGSAGADPVDDIAQHLERLARTLGLPTRLRELSLPREALALLAQDAIADPQARWNPRPVIEHELLQWLQTAW